MLDSEKKEVLTEIIVGLMTNEIQITNSVNSSRGKPTKKQLSERKKLIKKLNEIEPVDMDRIYNNGF